MKSEDKLEGLLPILCTHCRALKLTSQFLPNTIPTIRVFPRLAYINNGPDPLLNELRHYVILPYEPIAWPVGGYEVWCN